MDWTRSYTATWRVCKVNRQTWADADELTDVDSVSITRTADGSLLESGSLELSGEFEPDYYRIIMTAEQGGEVERVDVATLLFDIAGGKYNYGINSPSADGFSVLYPASATTMLAGEYAPKGVNGAEYAGKILEDAINAPVEVEGGFTLNDHVVHEVGSSVLDAAWDVLNAGGYIMQIDGRGTVHIRARPTEPSLILSNENARALMPEVSFESDISEVPNRYIVIDGDSKTVAINNDPESVVSLVRRGYAVDVVDTSPAPVDGETMSQYAERKLHELSAMKDERSYKREYAASVNLYSIVRASLDELEGDLVVQAQTIECANGIVVSEKAVKEIKLWT